ncbi:flavonol 3-sulfotransferase-like [Elaeis guineensis]|uniref:Sulfotransferase n=1 Tax=Elaeis guineensis var. tenera TaxID=51953 RepID=A0A6I9S8V9_ELAGV|nr:flavonol 3-sulfotransferase-like [Elaeis guineensis]
MATSPSPSHDSLPPKQQEDNSEPDPTRGQGIPAYKELISTLPSHKGWHPTLLLKYQDFWFPEYILPGIINLQQHFKACPSDLFLMSYPKSGTTWLKALAFATINRNRYQLANHPLLSHNPHDCIPVIDVDFASRIEGMPSPRILQSHCPFSLLPDSIKGSDCRIIYVCRDAKDVMVSDWFFTNRLRRSNEVELVQFGKAFELFCEGICYYGPIWDHVLEYWEESLRRPERVLFLKYEEMLADPAGNLKKLAEFMGCPFSPDEEKDGVVGEIVRLCSLEKLKNLEVNKRSEFIMPHIKFDYGSYFRKGEVGDWRNHMNLEMALRLDGIIREKIGGTGLTLGSVGDSDSSYRQPSS